MKRYRDLTRSLSTEAEQHGARLITIETTGRNHFKAVFVKDDGASVRMFLAATPSDNARTLSNDAAQARRLLRGIA
jgi:hypothetical protein